MSDVINIGDTIKDPNGDDCEVLQIAKHANGERRVAVYRSQDGSVLFMNYDRMVSFNSAKH